MHIFLSISGFGFVNFMQSGDGYTAIEKMNGAIVDERNIRVEKARRTGGYAKTPGKCNYEHLSIHSTSSYLSDVYKYSTIICFHSINFSSNYWVQSFLDFSISLSYTSVLTLTLFY